MIVRQAKKEGEEGERDKTIVRVIEGTKRKRRATPLILPCANLIQPLLSQFEQIPFDVGSDSLLELNPSRKAIELDLVKWKKWDASFYFHSSSLFSLLFFL